MKRLMMAMAAAFCAVTALADKPAAMLLHPGEYHDGTPEARRMMPAAWGIHFRKGEMTGWGFAWLRVRAQKPGTVKVFVNRVFEPIAPERGDYSRPEPKPFEQAVKAGQSWIRIPIGGRREMRFEVSCDAAETSCDVMVLTKDKDFDVSALDKEALHALPRRTPRTEAADRLFEFNPTMPLREYAERVARLYGDTPKPPVPMWDENGAALHNGKPYFPMMMYHSTFNRSESLLADVPLNVFPDRIPLEPSVYPRHMMFCGMMYQDQCYSDFYANARCQANAGCIERNAFAYLFDEPDNQYDAIGQRRLHELFKVVVPETPTVYCNCCFASLGEQCRACDYPCFDHYPIGHIDPWFSIEVIGDVVAKCRYESGNAPTFFVVQTYDQSKFMPYEGGTFTMDEAGLPTERELAAMMFLPVAEGARGLFFFNFRELHGDAPKTLPEADPVAWQHIKNFIGQLHVMESALVGPEVKLPWAAAGEASARVLVSADRKRGYLLVVNPTLHAVTQTLTPAASSRMASTKYTEVFNYGVMTEFLPTGKIILKMEELGSVLYRLSPNGLAALKKMSKSEVMSALKNRCARGLDTDEATQLKRRGQKRPAAPEKPQHFEKQ